jgi:Tfp pilus assembly ATPase PilU
MNYAPKILAYLAEGVHVSPVLLVAGAPPVEKTNNEFHIVINAVLTPEDIRDTLSFFASHARRAAASELGNQGVFAFGMPKMGRFKVHYLTQRGSVFVSVQRMTHDIPRLESHLSKPEQVGVLDAALNLSGGGLVICAGHSMDVLSRILYASLDRVNQTRSRVIYILEQNLSFLLRHRNSVVIQVEVGTDVASLDAGIQNALFLEPDLMYVRDPKTAADYAGLVCAAEAGALVLVSLVAADGQSLANELKYRAQDAYPGLSKLVRKTIKVTTDQGGTVLLNDLPGLSA